MNKKLLIFTLLFLLVSVSFVSARICERKDVLEALKKALHAYYTNSENSLGEDDLNSLISFYMGITGLIVDCTAQSTLMDKANALANMPRCPDGTSYGKCNLNNKPMYCYAGNLVPRCRLCGCPIGQSCDITYVYTEKGNKGQWGKCNPGTNITCVVDSDCGTSDYTGNYYCQNGDVYRDYTNHTCLNLGETNSECTTGTLDVLIDDCKIGEKCTEGQAECQTIAQNLTCSDGTLYGQCSTTKPQYCSSGTLVNNCTSCGCSIGTCQADGSCAGAYAVYHLDENSGAVAYDSSDNKRNCNLINMEESDWISGKLNNFLQFDGVNEYLYCGNIANFERNQSFSFESWIKTNTSAIMTIGGRYEYGSRKGWILFTANSPDRIRVIIGNSEANRILVSWNISYADDIFHHVVLTYDGSSSASGVKLYYDNQLQVPIIEANTLSLTILNVFYLVIGRYGSQDVYFWEGLLDEIIIYDKELTSSEVNDRWNNGVDCRGCGPSCGKIIQVTTNLAPEMNPAIYGDKIVWDKYNPNGNKDIYMYDTSTGQETQITLTDQLRPAIYGDKIIWGGSNGYYDIKLSKIIYPPGLSIGLHPTIYGDKIVWEKSNGYYDIKLGKMIYPPGLSIGYSPAIYGNRIVWMDERNGNWDIYMYDLSANQETQITTNTATQDSPAIYGDKIVWNDYRNGNWDIYMYDIPTRQETQIITEIVFTPPEPRPFIYNNKIVWHDYRNGHGDIYMYDISTGQKTQITTKSGDQLRPAIYGNKIVWDDEASGNGDIYTTTLC